jgi:transcriptional regulator with XRE-family HTH domain
MDQRYTNRILHELVARAEQLLEAQGMSQLDLAKKLGKSESEVSRMLSGAHNLTIKTVGKLCDALGEQLLVAQVSSLAKPAPHTKAIRRRQTEKPGQTATTVPSAESITKAIVKPASKPAAKKAHRKPSTPAL